MCEAHETTRRTPKHEWRKPELSRLSAGEAEGNFTGMQSDGPYTS